MTDSSEPIAALDDRPLAPAASPVPAAAEAPSGHDRARIARGLFALVISQILQMPLGLLVNAVLARKLGPLDFGAIYLATTTVSLAFLFVEWGQQASIAGAVARTPSRTESLLGTSLLLKATFGGVASGVLILLGRQLGYGEEARTALLFLSIQAVVMAAQQSGSSVLRGQEKTELVSILNLIGVALGAALSVSVALMGGGLVGVLSSMVVGSSLLLLPTAWVLRRNSVRRLRLDKPAIRELLGPGSAFLALNAILALQPYVDAAMLARYASPEMMGWHAASRRMVGLLIFPATSLGFTMYPTLARLHFEAPERLAELMRGALRLMILASVPAAVGTVLFAGPAVHLIYGKVGFEGAILNLQILSPYILLLYFTVLLGAVLVAIEKTKLWAAGQSLCVVVSVLANRPLIRIFQERWGNGAAGVSASSVLSEVVMVTIGTAMLPRAILRFELVRALLQSVVAGAAMYAAAWALSRSLPLAVTGSLVAYLATLFLLGAFRGQDLREVIGLVKLRTSQRVAARAG